MSKDIYNLKPLKSLHCPQCGYELPIYFKDTKLVKCKACKSNIFLEDYGARTIGEASQLAPEPSLIKLMQPFKYESNTYIPLGKIRYSYSRGYWEEYFLKSNDTRELWLSIDEGDFALEKSIDIKIDTHKLSIGYKYKDYVVSEIGHGRCIGFEGELPKLIELGSKYKYYQLTKGSGELITVEQNRQHQKIYMGKWIDPFDIEIL